MGYNILHTNVLLLYYCSGLMYECFLRTKLQPQKQLQQRQQELKTITTAYHMNTLSQYKNCWNLFFFLTVFSCMFMCHNAAVNSNSVIDYPPFTTYICSSSSQHTFQIQFKLNWTQQNSRSYQQQHSKQMSRRPIHCIHNNMNIFIINEYNFHYGIYV